VTPISATVLFHNTGSTFTSIYISLFWNNTALDGMNATIFYLLKLNSQRLEIQVTLNNNVKNHRVRALFPTKYPDITVLTDDHFEVLGNRPIGGTQPQGKFVSAKSKSREAGFTIANRGLPEYQFSSGMLSITLVRSTGKIGDWAPSLQKQPKNKASLYLITHLFPKPT